MSKKQRKTRAPAVEEAVQWSGLDYAPYVYNDIYVWNLFYQQRDQLVKACRTGDPDRIRAAIAAIVSTATMVCQSLACLDPDEHKAFLRTAPGFWPEDDQMFLAIEKALAKWDGMATGEIVDAMEAEEDDADG